MSDYIISCCSTADLSDERFKELGVPYLCFSFELGGTRYKDDMGKSVPPEELFRRMLAGEDTKTSQVPVGEYLEFFESYLKKGTDVLHITLSSGISGSYQSACIAADELREKYPDRKLYIVDSRGASSGYGLLVYLLCRLRDEGKAVDELYEWALAHRLNIHHWFFSTDLTFYVRGGRVSKTSGFVGKILNICPLLNMEDGGHLIPREKLRGKKKAYKRTVEMMEEHAEGGRNYSGKCFISNSACLDDAKAVAAMIEATFPNLDGPVEHFPIGATIGSHTGPGTVAVFFFGDERGE